MNKHADISVHHHSLLGTTYPKLLFVAEPGALVSPAFGSDLAAALKHCAVIHLGPGRHNMQEDHAEAIGRSVAGWIGGIEAATSRQGRQAAWVNT